MKKHVVWR